MDQHCNSLINHNTQSNEQLISALKSDYDVKLTDAKMEVAVAHQEIERLKQKCKSALDRERARHKASFVKLKKAHDQRIETKNKRMETMWEEMDGMREIMYEMIDEVQESKQLEKAAIMAATSAQTRVS